VVVVAEWILEPGLEDLLFGLGRVAGCIDPHAGLPQPEVAQDALDDLSLVDEGHDAHLVLAMGAQQRVDFPDLLDEFAPLLGGDAAVLGLGELDDIPPEPAPASIKL